VQLHRAMIGWRYDVLIRGRNHRGWQLTRRGVERKIGKVIRLHDPDYQGHWQRFA
jgi:hypothetical protein